MISASVLLRAPDCVLQRERESSPVIRPTSRREGAPMIAFRRVAVSLTVVRVFLPNGDFRTRHAERCDPKTPLALAAERRDSLRAKPGRPANDSDEQWARLALSAPGGFAGAYLDSSRAPTAGNSTPRRLIVRLARPEERDSALQVLVPKIRELRGQDAERVTLLEHLGSLGIPCGLVQVVVTPAGRK